MTSARDNRILIVISALLFSTLACNYATRLIFPATPAPIPTAILIPSATVTPFLPPAALTPTIVAYTPSCPNSLKQILRDSTQLPKKISTSESDTEPDIVYMVYYEVVDGKLQKPFYESIPNNLLKDQKDLAAQQKIWDFFTQLIPADQRTMISGFTIFTDGKLNYLASVSQSDNSPYMWELNVDYADADPKTELTFTLLHEFGHLLTLNRNQLDVSISVYEHPNSKSVYQKEENACPQYFTGEGCSKENSYINQFFNLFWLDLYKEWKAIDDEPNQTRQLHMLDRFYNTYKDQFLTEYAPTSPAEDIAESWTFFLLAPKPQPDSIANEKILFFYNYPELIDLRSQILQRLCSHFQD